MKPTPIPELKYWTHGQLKYLENCPYCQTEISKIKYSRKDDDATWTDIWHLYQCHKCSSIYLNPRPDMDSLPKAYKNYYTHTNVKNNKELFDNSIKTHLINGYLNSRFLMKRKNALPIGFFLFKYFAPLRNKLDNYGRNIPRILCNPNTKLLDIGFGNGDFLLRAQEMRVEPFGIENDPVSVKNINRFNINTHLGELSSANYPKNYFDYITLNHVIEHVENPQELLQEIYGILKYDGTIWLSLPNPNALGLKVFKQGWKGFHPPFHLFIPSQKSLKTMLENSGFIDIKLVSQGLQSKGLWHESKKISTQEDISLVNIWAHLTFLLSNILSCFTSKYAEETIITAKRSKDN